MKKVVFCKLSIIKKRIARIGKENAQLAHLKPKSSSKDRFSQMVYNAYNQIAYQIDAEGAVIAFDYDAEGQVIKKTAYAIRLRDRKN